MRIITPVKIYFTYFVLLVSLLGYNSTVYSQCPTVSNLNQSFCDIQSPTIASLAATSTGGGVRWFANATGGTALLGSTGLVNGEDYFADDTTGACGVRQKVIVKVYSSPTGANFQGVCVTSLNQATPSNPQFVISGNNLKWYLTSSGGTAISNSTILSDNTIYYISQTNPDTGCETSRLQLFVNVGLVPIPTGPAVQEFCNVVGSSPTVADLVATGNNNWYSTSTFGVPLSLSTPLVNGQFYYATTVDPPCESSDRLQVLVNIYEPNNAGTDGTRSLCIGQISTTPSFNLFNLLGGTPDASGVWTGPITTTNGSQGTLNPSTMTLAGSPYVFTYTVSSALCATDTSTVTIIINPTPTVTVTSPPVCQGTVANVTATVSPSGTYSYVWTVPSGAPNPGNVSTFTTTTAGVYSVIVTNTNTTCPSQPAQTTVVINPKPTVTVTSPSVCQGSLATVTATPSPAGTYNYVWTVPAGATNPGNVASFTTATAGVYSVVITNPTTTCSSLPGQTTVVINPIPTVTVSSPAVCQGTPATVTATANPSGTYNYVWTVPSGATNPGNVATFTTNTPGIYSVIATNTNTTCPSLPAQTTVIINPKPTVTVTSLPVCEGLPAPVVATVTPIGIYTYTWTVPAGATNPGNVAAFVTTTPGIYSVIATNPTTTCPSLPAQTTVIINPRPIVTVTSPPVCQGTPATVTATTSPSGTYAYTWTVPAGATNPGNVASFTTTTPGVYSVIAINTSTTCLSLPAQTTVVINPKPTVTVTSPPVCQGTPATVTATPTPSGTYTYVWTVPAGATNPGNVAIFTTNTAGIYSVIATNPTTTCPSLPAQTTVVINPKPTITVTSPPVCQGTPATVTATATPSGTYTYTWTVPAGATNPGNVATFTTSIAGIYSVIATNPTTTCPSLPAQTTVVINPKPTVTVTSPPVCQGTPATVTATPTPAGTYTYVWTVPAGATNPGNVATFTTAIAGIYSVIATNSTTTCPSLPAQTTVVINSKPTVTVTSPPVCQGTPATVTATATPSGTYTYVWTVPAGATNPGNVATFTTSIAGIYSVIVTNPTTTCPSLPAQTTVVINPRPTLTVTSPTVCQGTPATVTVTPNPAGTYTYVWTVPAGATNPGNAATFTTTIPGVYNVTATNSTTACPSLPAQTTVVINPAPDAGTNGTKTFCSNATPEDLFLSLGGTPQAGGIWTPTLSNGDGVFDPVVDPSGTYTYTVIGIAPCADATATVVVNVIEEPQAGNDGELIVCSDSPSEDLFLILGPGTQTGGTWSPAMASGTGVFNPAVDPQGDYTYTITGTPPCVSDTAVVSVTVNLAPDAGTNGTKTFCSNAAPEDLLLSLGGTPQAGGIWTPTLSNGDGVFDPVVDASGTYTYTIVGIAPCVDATATVTVNVIEEPQAGNDGELIVCTDSPSEDLFLILGPGTQTGGTWSPAMASGTGVFNPAVDPQGDYTYTITGTPPCASDTAVVSVTVNLAPDAGTNGTKTFCSNAAPEDLLLSLGGTPQAGGIWTPTLSNGDGVFDPVVDASGTYTYTITGIAPCVDATATVTVNVIEEPQAGNDGELIVCSDSPSEDLFLILGPGTQTGGTWSPAMASGTGVFNPAVDPQGDYTYTITGTAPCASDTAVVTVTVNPLPDAGTDGSLTICSNQNPVDLFASLQGTPQTGGTWSPAMASGTGVFNPAIDPQGDYTYTITGTAPCGNDTAVVSVTVNLAPDAGTNGTKTFCSNAAPEDLLLSLGGTPQAGGIWTPTLSNGDGVFDPVVDASGTYTYTIIGIAPCVDATATVTVNVIEEPQAGNDGELIVCTDSPSEDLFLILGPGTQTGGTWTPTLASGTGVFNPAVDPQGDYTYTITGTAPCGNDTAVVSVTVNLAPDAGTNGTLAICSNQNPVDLFDSLQGTPQTGGIWTPTLASGTGIFDPVVDVAGTYTYTITGLAPCTDATASATVTVTDEPQAGNDGELIVCANSPSEDLFLILGPGTQTGGTWSPALASGTGVFNPAVDPQGDYTYTITGTAPCANDTAVITVTVNPIPNAGTNGNLAICSNQNPVDLFDSLQGTPQTGGIWTPTLASGTGIFDPVVDVAGTYTYTITGLAPCTDATASATVTVTDEPQAGNDGELIVCANSPSEDLFLILGPGTQTGGTWSPALASGTGVFNPSVDPQGDYTYTITGTAPCANDTAVITVTVNQIPNAGTNGTLAICSNQNPVDLFDSLQGMPQTGGIWTPTLASGTGIFDPVVDVAGTYTYTITGLAPCTDATASATVTVTDEPQAGNDGELIVCANSPSEDLFLILGPGTQTGGTWSPALASGTGVFNPAVDPQGDYTYTITGTAPCANDTAVITVTINPLSDAGTNGTKTFCSNGTPEDLFLSLGGTPEIGGVWSPALTSGTGVFDPTVDTAATYTYTVGVCTPSATATVIVSIISAPNSGGIGQTITSCANVTSVDLFNGLDGTQGTGSWSDDDASGALLNNIFNPSTVGVGTYHFTYTVIGTAPCGTSTSTVTVIVNSVPNAGTAVTPPSVCTSVGTIDLNTLLIGQDTGGTWSDTNPVDISTFAAATYTYTYSVTNSCGTATTDVQFIVLPNPILTSTNVTSSQVCIGTDVVVNLTGMVDGPYNLNYSLSGSNTLANQITTVTIIGGIGSFTIPAASVPNAGTTTITFDTIQNANSNCQITLNNVIGTITINPLVQIGNANIAVSSICLGSDAVVEIANAVTLPDGVYQFEYTISDGNPVAGNSGNVTITGGNGQFTVPASVFGTVNNYTITISGITYTSGCSNTTQDANITFAVVGPLTAGTFSGIQSVCPSVGIFDLATLLTGQSTGGVWTDSASVAVTSPLNIINFAAGTYSYTYIVTNACGTDTEGVQFTILPTPQLTTVNISTTPTCIGTNATINLSGMADGTYTLNYDLSGSNTLAGQSVVVTIVAGIGSFTIPTASIPNVGTTIITFTSIANTTSTCTTILTNVAAQIIITPLADIDNSNLSVANVCLGDAIVVAIAGATNLPDGVYQFNYSIPTANPASGTTGNVTITSGVGSFTIPGSSFTTAANYTITITGIITSTGCSNTNETASTNFTINPLLNTTGATVSALDTCPNFGSLVTISGATALADGTYSITYQLSGANTATTTISVTFTGGVASFTIPATDIISNGDTTITFTQLSLATATCGITGTIFTNDVFNVASLPSPELIVDGYQFCGTNVPAPTIADLSANVVGTPAMIWYDAATGGTAYSNTDLLVDGATYYGAVLSVNGCESSKLEVKVDLSFCDIEIPDGFSPNNDGINDTFEIPNLAILYPNFKMEIYNRYGNLIYTGNKNVPNFDGTTTENGFKLGNNLLPTGVYFYILEFNDGIRKAIQGRLYLNR